MVLAGDEKNQETDADNAVKSIKHLFDWLKIIEEKLIPQIAFIYRDVITEIENAEDIRRLADICQKRMFTAIKNGRMEKFTNGNNHQEMIDSLIQSLQIETDTFYPLYNPLPGYYHRKGDTARFFTHSTFEEMFANAPMLVVTENKTNIIQDGDNREKGDKEDEEKIEKTNILETHIYIRRGAMEADENNLLKHEPYGFLNYSQNPKLAKELTKDGIAARKHYTLTDRSTFFDCIKGKESKKKAGLEFIPLNNKEDNKTTTLGKSAEEAAARHRALKTQ